MTDAAIAAARPLNVRFVGFEERGRTIMINIMHVASLEDVSQGKKPRLEVYLVGDPKDQPRYVLPMTLKEFFQHCRLL
ncbi:MAG TPA: hypothetical protein VK116_20490 [Planctomycetota bacterium]|nr:hypothetical protein [Planctomycetota bacterium]